MKNPSLSLVTLDYPPQRGGVARYLGNLVDASHGAIAVTVRPASSRWWSLVWTCWRQRGSILFVSHAFPVGTAAWIARLFGGPEYIVLFHGLDVRRVQTPFKQKVFRAIARGARALLVNSLATGQELERLLPKASYTVLTPGVEVKTIPSRQEAREGLGIAADAYVVISVARLVSRKGLDVAIRAMAQIQKEQPVEYVILGNGADLKRLQQIEIESGAKVRWVLDASDTEKWTWLAAADVFALPARDEGDDVEGFGIVFLEAALAGVPSVAGRSGGVPEAVIDGETGILVDPMRTEDVARAIRDMLENETLREKLGRAAQMRAREEFRWSSRWDTLVNVLGI